MLQAWPAFRGFQFTLPFQHLLDGLGDELGPRLTLRAEDVVYIAGNTMNLELVRHLGETRAGLTRLIWAPFFPCWGLKLQGGLAEVLLRLQK